MLFRSHSFMVITGSRSHDLQSTEWQAATALARAGGTLIVLMGLSRLSSIAETLIGAGCSPTLPIASPSVTAAFVYSGQALLLAQSNALLRASLRP